SSSSNCSTWSKWFRDGREDVEDEERVGRPITETTTENIRQVEDFINDDPYITINELEPESGLIINEVKKQRPILGVQSIKLHHDNGKPHIHEDVVSHLQSEGVRVMSHPSNSSDLSPCDFCLFDLIKQNIGDQDDAESLHEAVTKFMKSLKKKEYKKTFDKWIERMHLCINNHGDYFEHLI
ncbi:unnamed protein product, partial [Didymodactylos carnosus]